MIAAGLIGIFPPVYLIITALLFRRHPDVLHGIAPGISAIVVVAMTVVHSRTIRWLKLPLWQSLLLPASMLLYAIISANSYRQYHFAGGNVWKGRKYDPRRLRQSMRPPGV